MKLILPATIALSLAGATFAHAVPARDVAFYTANPGLRKATLARCLNDPGGLGKTADCVNAKTAESRAILNPENKKMFKLKPLSER